MNADTARYLARRDRALRNVSANYRVDCAPFLGCDVAAREGLIANLMLIHEAECRRSASGHWTYKRPDHDELCWVIRNEQALLAQLTHPMAA